MHGELDRLLALYERGVLTRRQLLAAMVALAVGAPAVNAAVVASRELPRARTLNHVTLSVADLARSRAFYERLLGVQGQVQGTTACVFGLENGFFMVETYAREGGVAAHPRGIDHVCVGLEAFEPKETLAAVRQRMPDAGARLGGLKGDQVYVRDPDGASVQLCPADYKR